MGLDSPSRCIVDSGGKCEEKQLLSAVFRYENAHRYLHWMHLRDLTVCGVTENRNFYGPRRRATSYVCDRQTESLTDFSNSEYFCDAKKLPKPFHACSVVVK